jgi:hypothetical protein
MTSAADVLNYLKFLGHYEPEAYDFGEVIVAKSAIMRIVTLSKAASWADTKNTLDRAMLS